jgi:hypothetical protein
VPLGAVGPAEGGLADRLIHAAAERCLPRLRILRIALEARRHERSAPSDSDLGVSSFSAEILGSTFERKLFPVMGGVRKTK